MPASSNPSRRRFLSGSAAAGLAGFPHIARSDQEMLSRPGLKPRKIIHLISDGLSAGTLTCADLFSQSVRGKPLSWTQMLREPEVRLGVMNTRSLNSMVTDSAAASSAWGSGSRVVNGVLNVLPDGTKLTALYSLFAAQGWKTGLVTTAEITHATPAGYVVAQESRSEGEDIALQYLDARVDILLGGGLPHFSARNRRDKRNLAADFTAAGYTVASDLASLDQAPLDTPLLGVFADGHLPYALDLRSDPEALARVPSLARMTRAALERLQRHERFILQVEGARIDHAAHNSDAAAALQEQIALDEALDVCLEFQMRHPDTLIVVTTDHGNSNLGLNGMGGNYSASSQRFATLAQVKHSLPEVLRLLEKAGSKFEAPVYPTDPEDSVDGAKAGSPSKFTGAVQMASAVRVKPKVIVEILGQTTGYAPSLRRAELFARVLARDYPMLYDQMNTPVTQLGQILANRTGLGWTGNTHTADYVGLMARGPGSERFAGFLENTDLFRRTTELAGIDFRNLSAPLIADSGPSAEEAELGVGEASLRC